MILPANPMLSIIGFVLLFAGILKSLNSQLYFSQLLNLKFLPKSLVPFLTILSIELECALGVGLILQLFLGIVIPAAIFFLGFGLLFTLLGKISQKLHTCSCYSQIIWIPLPVSIALNLAYLVILNWSWWLLKDDYLDDSLWQVVCVIFSIGFSGFLTKQSLKKPLWDTTITRPGRKINKGWFKNVFDEFSETPVLIVLMHPNCHICKEWLRKINFLLTLDLPFEIVGVINTKNQSDDIFKEISHYFKVVTIEPGKFYYLASRFPTALLIEEGIIRKKWQLQFPDELIP